MFCFRSVLKVKRLFPSGLLVITVIVAGLSGAVYAAGIDYTVQGAEKYRQKPVQKERPTHNSSHKKEQAVCGNAEQKAMKHYERLLSSYEKDVEEFQTDPTSMENKNHRESFIRDLNKLFDFGSSQDFETVKESYKKCNIELPRSKLMKPYWMP